MGPWPRSGGEWWARAGELAEAPTHVLQEWTDKAYAELRQKEREAALNRAKRWREQVATDVAKQPGKVFSWCKGAFRRVPEGTEGQGLTYVDPTEVAQAVQGHWEKWWLQEALGDDGDLAALWAAAVASPLPKLSWEKLRRAVNRYPPHKAGGPDQWQVQDLKGLPDDAFKHLATLLEVVEATGVWPVGLTGATVVKVAKDGAEDATGLRPIGLMAMVYRVWAATRGAEVLQWITTVDPSLAGGRPGAGADVLALELGLFAEAEIASGGGRRGGFPGRLQGL